MTFQAVRAHIESKVADAFTALTPSLPVVWENVQEKPPELPYVICLVSYGSTTESVICQTEGNVENLTGNIQVSIYVPRGGGMKALEEYCSTAMFVFNTMYDWSSSVRVRCGQINGPVPLLNGPEPYALATISCSFGATVD
jgi:hypothetical protein